MTAIIKSAAARLLLALALIGASSLAFAQVAPPHVPLQKMIGQARPEVVPSLIVMNAGGAVLDGGTLTDIAANAIVFADRPVRAAGHALTSTLLDEWNPSYPPNPAVSVFGEIDGSVRDAVVVLSARQMSDNDLTFAVEVLEGDLTGATGPAAVFIDIIGRPLTPLSCAGVARRTAYRSACYAGAASEAANAYAHPPCGYAPYPPCH